MRRLTSRHRRAPAPCWRNGSPKRSKNGLRAVGWSAMAKTAVLAMTKSLAVEWGPKGIRTVAIAPGPFPTAGATGQLRPEGRDDSWTSRNPLGRVGEHGELADLASFLISDQAGYINGEMVVQDGGAHLRSSGAEDLLQWTDAQWQKQRERRPKG